MANFLKKLFKSNDQEFIFKEYGHKVYKFKIEEIGDIEYAEWLHPYCKLKEITADKVDFYSKFVSKGGMAVDIGAHTGDTTVPMALAVGKDGLVIAIEPNKYVFKVLEKNAELNSHLTNIKPYCFAATADDGNFIFNYSDASFCNGGYLSQIKNKRHHHNYELEVNGRNLNKFLNDNYSAKLNHLELIKIDAEGYDKEILKTISVILDKYKPNLLAECYKRLNKIERDELYDILDNHGYDVFLIDDLSSLNNIRKLEKKNMSDVKHFEILAIHKSKLEEVLSK